MKPKCLHRSFVCREASIHTRYEPSLLKTSEMPHRSGSCPKRFEAYWCRSGISRNLACSQLGFVAEAVQAGDQPVNTPSLNTSPPPAFSVAGVPGGGERVGCQKWGDAIWGFWRKSWKTPVMSIIGEYFDFLRSWWDGWVVKFSNGGSYFSSEMSMRKDSDPIHCESGKSVAPSGRLHLKGRQLDFGVILAYMCVKLLVRLQCVSPCGSILGFILGTNWGPFWWLSECWCILKV